MTRPWVRAVVTALWCAFAAYVLLVLAGRGDLLGAVQATGWAILAVGEAVALARGVHDGDTISERVTRWLRGRPVRAALLVIGMIVLAAHWLAGYP